MLKELEELLKLVLKEKIIKYGEKKGVLIIENLILEVIEMEKWEVIKVNEGWEVENINVGIIYIFEIY